MGPGLRGCDLPRNEPFLSCSKPLFQSEAKCEAIDMKMFLYSHANITHFHKIGFCTKPRSKNKSFTNSEEAH